MVPVLASRLLVGTQQTNYFYGWPSKKRNVFEQMFGFELGNGLMTREVSQVCKRF